MIDITLDSSRILTMAVQGLLWLIVIYLVVLGASRIR